MSARPGRIATRSILLCLPIAFAACKTTTRTAPPPDAPDTMVDPVLTKKLTEALAGFRGDAGVYVRHLASGREASVRGDDLFPTASLVKVPILVGVFDRLEKGQLTWRQDLVYDRAREYAGEDLLANFRDGQKIPMPALLMLMISMSDNTASLWAQELAGTGTAINGWLGANGFDKTRVNSRTPGREADREKMGWGQSTPREMTELLVRIRTRRAVSASASERMERILARPYWDGEAISQLPPEIHVLSKQGSVSRARSEVLLVDAPSGAYAFTVMTNNQADEAFGPNNEGFVLIRRVSKLLWDTFEPDRPYQAADGSERFRW